VAFNWLVCLFAGLGLRAVNGFIWLLGLIFGFAVSFGYVKGVLKSTNTIDLRDKRYYLCHVAFN